MTANPTTCSLQTNLAAAAALMLATDCGFLPVVDDQKLVGVVTDRDMFVALATRNQLASQVTVAEVVTMNVVTCQPEDDVHVALDAMKEHRVRRMPVAGLGRAVMGVVSMNDILLAAGPAMGVRIDKVVDTFQSICAHRHHVSRVTAA
jgi:CBS domain-containing protein